MTQNHQSRQQKVLKAYAEATHRADVALEAVRLEAKPPLEQARQAVRDMRTGAWKEANTALEAALALADSTYARALKLADEEHQAALGALVLEFDRRRGAAETERDDFLHDPRVHYQMVCHALHSSTDPGCLPAYDALMVAESEADQRRSDKIAAANADWELGQERQEVAHNARVLALLEEKNQAQAAAHAEHQRVGAELLQPLQAALETAQAVYDERVAAATTIDLQSRRRRLEVLGAFEGREITAQEAIESFAV